MPYMNWSFDNSDSNTAEIASTKRNTEYQSSGKVDHGAGVGSSSDLGSAYDGFFGDLQARVYSVSPAE